MDANSDWSDDESLAVPSISLAGISAMTQNKDLDFNQELEATVKILDRLPSALNFNDELFQVEASAPLPEPTLSEPLQPLTQEDLNVQLELNHTESAEQDFESQFENILAMAEQKVLNNVSSISAFTESFASNYVEPCEDVQEIEMESSNIATQIAAMTAKLAFLQEYASAEEEKEIEDSQVNIELEPVHNVTTSSRPFESFIPTVAPSLGSSFSDQLLDNLILKLSQDDHQLLCDPLSAAQRVMFNASSESISIKKKVSFYLPQEELAQAKSVSMTTCIPEDEVIPETQHVLPGDDLPTHFVDLRV